MAADESLRAGRERSCSRTAVTWARAHAQVRRLWHNYASEPNILVASHGHQFKAVGTSHTRRNVVVPGTASQNMLLACWRTLWILQKTAAVILFAVPVAAPFHCIARHVAHAVWARPQWERTHRHSPTLLCINRSYRLTVAPSTSCISFHSSCSPRDIFSRRCPLPLSPIVPQSAAFPLPQMQYA